MRHALGDLRLRRVRLLAGPEGETAARRLDLDVAETVAIEAAS